MPKWNQVTWPLPKLRTENFSPDQRDAEAKSKEAKAKIAIRKDPPRTAFQKQQETLLKEKVLAQIEEKAVPKQQTSIGTPSPAQLSDPSAGLPNAGS